MDKRIADDQVIFGRLLHEAAQSVTIVAIDQICGCADKIELRIVFQKIFLNLQARRVGYVVGVHTGDQGSVGIP